MSLFTTSRYLVVPMFNSVSSLSCRKLAILPSARLIFKESSLISVYISL